MQRNHYQTWLQEYDIPGIFGVDTRELTKKLRTKGTLLGKIIHDHERKSFYDPNKENLAAEVSIKEPVTYTKGKRTILLVDCGTKNSLIQSIFETEFHCQTCSLGLRFHYRKG